MEQGWDKEVKTYFRKILSTISWGFIWTMVNLVAGIYFRLAWHPNRIVAGVFYMFCLISLGFLLRYYYRLWRK